MESLDSLDFPICDPTRPAKWENDGKPNISRWVNPNCCYEHNIQKFSCHIALFCLHKMHGIEMSWGLKLALRMNVNFGIVYF